MAHASGAQHAKEKRECVVYWYSFSNQRWGGEVERTGNGAGKRGEEVGNGCGCLTGA